MKDEAVVIVCPECQRLRLLRSCVELTESGEATLSRDVAVSDFVKQISPNVSIKRTVAPGL